MKKLFIVAAVAVFGLTACKKDWTCSCEYAGGKQDFPINGAKKADAQDACDVLAIGGKCELK